MKMWSWLSHLSVFHLIYIKKNIDRTFQRDFIENYPKFFGFERFPIFAIFIFKLDHDLRLKSERFSIFVGRKWDFFIFSQVSSSFLVVNLTKIIVNVLDLSIMHVFIFPQVRLLIFTIYDQILWISLLYFICSKLRFMYFLSVNRSSGNFYENYSNFFRFEYCSCFHNILAQFR